MPKILFAGTPDICVPLLKALAKDFDVVGVLTSCDKSVGRSSKLVPPAAKEAAVELGLPVLQFDTLKGPAREAVKALGADTLISFAFGKIFGPMFLNLFPVGKFNVHPSDLPMFRGPSPIQSTIASALTECTISLQSLGLGMDEGEIWAKNTFNLDGTENTESLTDKVAQQAALFVPNVLKDIFEGKTKSQAQVVQASYCTMINREMGRLDFNCTVKELHCKIRTCYPWPKAWARVNDSDIAITGVWGGFDYINNPDSNQDKEVGTVVTYRKDRGIGVSCADGIIWLTALQLPAKKELDYKSFINGNQWILKARFE